MSINLEAHFEEESLANRAVDRLRQSGIMFDILDLKPAAARWKTDENLQNRASDFPSGGFVAQARSGMPFNHMCANINAQPKGVNEIKRDREGSMVLRISVSPNSLGKAEKLIRNGGGYSLKVFS